MSIMEIKQVGYSYDNKKKVLKGVNAEMEQGKLYAILGPSGCGKTTLLSLIGGLDSPGSGQIYFDGQDIAKTGLSDHRKNHVAFIFQAYNLIDYLTPAENVSLTSKLPPLPILERLGLTKEEAKRNVLKLSGGQRQRVGIAQALLGNPPFLIFDEPTVGLDPEERIHFRNLFSRTAEDRLVLLSTHIIEDVQSVCDQIVVINHGNILFTGTPEQLIQSAAGHVGVFWEKDEVQEKGLHITARVNTSQGIRCRAVADKLPAYAQADEPSLEDAYLYLISREVAQ